MSDLVEFLRARLDEDEAKARRAGDSFRQVGETGVIVATEGDRAEECATANWTGVAEHIARHDPARVLAEVDATRRILGWADTGALPAYEVEYVLTALALPYADHPDYDEAWRPA